MTSLSSRIYGITPLSDSLYLVVERTRDNLVLLLFRQLYEVYRISAYSYGELGIFLGVLLRIEERFSGKNVYVQVVSALFDVAVKQGD